MSASVSFSSGNATGGAQTQVYSFGVSNIFLNTRNPKATIWRAEHTPYTHFAYADVQVSIQGTATFGNRFVCDFDRMADLIADVNMRFTLRAWTEGATVAGTFPEDDPDLNYWYTDDFGNAMVDDLQFFIGNNVFEKFDGTYMHIYDEALSPPDKQTGVETGKIGSELARIEAARFDQDLIVPIPSELFNQPTKAIEAVAISRQRMRIQVALKPLAQLIRVQGAAAVTAYNTAVAADKISPNGGSNELQDMHLQVHYVWLTAGERSIILAIPSLTLYREVQKGLELQHPETQGTLDYGYTFNNAANDLIFVCRLEEKHDYNVGATSVGYEWFDFSGPNVALGGVPPVESARPPFTSFKLLINNTERLAATPVYLEETLARTHYLRKSSKGIYLYPFARYPCHPDPSGSLNFSMIDHQRFRWTFDMDADLVWEGVILVYVRAWQIMTRTTGVAQKELQSQ
jgi:Major capsid protein N-terminus/Large eukaryotic DNA virus major capsid protein